MDKQKEAICLLAKPNKKLISSQVRKRLSGVLAQFEF